MTTVILVPVLNRPHRVRPLIESVEQATPEPHRLLFIAQHGDTDELRALDDARADYLISDRQSYPCKINDGYRATTEPYLFLAADDLQFHPGWLTAALALMTDETRVVGTNDLFNPRVLEGRHSTHTLVRRSYCHNPGATADEPQTVLCEQYRHAFVDDELVGVAQSRGVYAHAHDSVVEHLHPYAGKAERDATYKLGMSAIRVDRHLHKRRRRLWQSPLKSDSGDVSTAAVMTRAGSGPAASKLADTARCGMGPISPAVECEL